MDTYQFIFMIILYPFFAQSEDEQMLFPEAEKYDFPDLQTCIDRPTHLRSSAGISYYLSWMDKKEDETWNGARNFCRRMCMDLVSLETMGENEWIKSWIEKLRVREVWTSGRLCNFRGCEKEYSPHLWPLELYGWFWAATGVYLYPSDNPYFTDWSSGGPYFVTQPDNREFRYTGRQEACLAIINNRYRDGIAWHDELCDSSKPFICEENLEMLELVKTAAPHVFVESQYGVPDNVTKK